MGMISCDSWSNWSFPSMSIHKAWLYRNVATLADPPNLLNPSHETSTLQALQALQDACSASASGQISQASSFEFFHSTGCSHQDVGCPRTWQPSVSGRSLGHHRADTGAQPGKAAGQPINSQWDIMDAACRNLRGLIPKDSEALEARV